MKTAFRKCNSTRGKAEKQGELQSARLLSTHQIKASLLPDSCRVPNPFSPDTTHTSTVKKHLFPGW